MAIVRFVRITLLYSVQDRPSCSVKESTALLVYLSS